MLSARKASPALALLLLLAPIGRASAQEGAPAATGEPPASGDPSPAGDSRPPSLSGGDGLLRFSFRDAEWPSVLEWIADAADLSLDMTDVPTGEFNYVDDNRHTVTQALDVINGYLLPRGYLLIRRDSFLVVTKTDSPLLPNLIPTIPASRLGERGDNELLRIVVPIEGFSPQSVADQIVKILGPNGLASPLDASDSLVLQGFGKSLREAVTMLESINAPPADDQLVFRSFPLQHIQATDAERQVQTLFGLGSNPFQASIQQRAAFTQQRRDQRGRGGEDEQQRPASPTPLVQNIAMNMKVSALRHTNSLLVTATPAAIELIEGILQTIDVPPRGGEVSGFTSNTPVLRVYTVANADEDDVAETIDSVLPGVVINEDGRNNSIHVLATPAEHAQVQEMIDVIDSGGMGNGVEVIQLTQSDPAMMSDLLASLFQNEDRDDQPVITPDFRNRSLIVRASASQMAEIRKTLASFSEGVPEEGGSSGRGRFRRLPLGDSSDAGRVARVVKELLDADERFSNEINIVTPSSSAPAADRRDQSADDLRSVPVDAEAAVDWASGLAPTPIVYQYSTAVRVASLRQPVGDDTGVSVDGASEDEFVDPSRVTIEVRGDELLLYSNDDIALDEVEDTIRDLVRQMPSRTQWTVFFLRAASVDSTAQTLVQLLQNDYGASAIVGAGPDYGYDSEQTMRIVPDARTNSLFISGPEAQVERAQRFLRFLDTTDLPASLRDRVPRAIPVHNAKASDIAAMVRELYKDFMVDPAAQGQRGGGGGRGGRNPNQQPPAVTATQSASAGLKPSGIQLTIAVDEAANTLLVSCNDQLFQQISDLVAARDLEAVGTEPVTRVVQVRPGVADKLEAALEGLWTDSDARPQFQRTPIGQQNNQRTQFNRPQNNRRGQFNFNPQQFQRNRGGNNR